MDVVGDPIRAVSVYTVPQRAEEGALSEPPRNYADMPPRDREGTQAPNHVPSRPSPRGEHLVSRSNQLAGCMAG